MSIFHLLKFCFWDHNSQWIDFKDQAQASNKTSTTCRAALQPLGSYLVTKPSMSLQEFHPCQDFQPRIRPHSLIKVRNQKKSRHFPHRCGSHDIWPVQRVVGTTPVASTTMGFPTTFVFLGVNFTHIFGVEKYFHFFRGIYFHEFPVICSTKYVHFEKSNLCSPSFWEAFVVVP